MPWPAPAAPRCRQSPTKEAWSSERLLPVERLSKLDVDADLTFGQLTLEKLPIHNAVLKANGQGGLLTLDEPARRPVRR
jgi:AsmA protein